MSGIYIKGMEMPINCMTCPCADNAGCAITGAIISSKAMAYGRTDDCPLVPVPDHGRLVDADALDINRREEQARHYYELNQDDEYFEGVKDGLHEAAKQLSIAPTIITASGGAE